MFYLEFQWQISLSINKHIYQLIFPNQKQIETRQFNPAQLCAKLSLPIVSLLWKLKPRKKSFLCILALRSLSAAKVL